MSSIKKRPDGRYRARYRDHDGREYARHFTRKVDAQSWIDAATASLISGSHVSPRSQKITVNAWCDRWLEGYQTHRPGTVRQAEVHLVKIRAAFGQRRLASIKPSDVKSWTSTLAAEGLAPSYIYALHSRLAQLFSDAVHDGIVSRSPLSRKTSPGMAKQRAYVATTEQVWALHDNMPAHLRPTILLAAFAGLRLGEVCGLRVTDVDFLRSVVNPAVQYPADPLKSDTSRNPIPIPKSMTEELSAHVAAYRAETMFTNELGQQLAPWTLERAFRAARVKISGLPGGFRFHDLRHYFASLLIDSGANVKVVQARLRHASAKTTLDTYAHLFPDSDDSTRAAIESVLADRADYLRTSEGGGA